MVAASSAALVQKIFATIGDTVAIFGVGGVGVHAVLLCRYLHCKTIGIDISEDRLEVAKNAGADLVINASSMDPVQAVTEVTDMVGANCVIDLVGSPKTVGQSIASVRKGGKVVLVGLHPGTFMLKPIDIILREMDIKTSIDHLSKELEDVIELAAAARIDLSRSITHRVRLDEVNEGIRMLEERIDNPTRIVVLPN